MLLMEASEPASYKSLGGQDIRNYLSAAKNAVNVTAISQ